MLREATMIIMHIRPHGKLFISDWESSQYLSHVRYQHTARLSSSENKNNLCKQF